MEVELTGGDPADRHGNFRQGLATVLPWFAFGFGQPRRIDSRGGNMERGANKNTQTQAT